MQITVYEGGELFASENRIRFYIHFFQNRMQITGYEGAELFASDLGYVVLHPSDPENWMQITLATIIHRHFKLNCSSSTTTIL